MVFRPSYSLRFDFASYQFKTFSFLLSAPSPQEEGGGKEKKGKKKMLGLKCETMFRPSRRRTSFRRRFRKWRSELSVRTSKRPSRQSGKLRTALPALPDCCSGIYGTDTRRQKPGVSAREISSDQGCQTQYTVGRKFKTSTTLIFIEKNLSNSNQAFL